VGWQGWLSVLALLVAAAALGVAVVVLRRSARTPGGPVRVEVAEGARPVAFVLNPTKPEAAELRDAALQACATRYLPEPVFLETTAEDPGVGQARRALDMGVSTVVAAGGDGTVRAVAEALVGSGVPMGIVPMGTGNLFARNLDLPLTRRDEQLRLALTGSPRPVDVGWLHLDPADEEAAGEKHLFLVIAGLGFDASMVEDTDDELKARVGWIAYFLAGAKHLNGRRMRLQVQVDSRPATTVRARTVLLGNCGKLPGGLTLLPGAEVDDGWLDIAAIDTRGGIAGWLQLFGEVVLQGVGLRTDLPKMGRIDHTRARSVTVVSDRPVPVQVDGEPLGRAARLRTEVAQHELLVRAP